MATREEIPIVSVTTREEIPIVSVTLNPAVDTSASVDRVLPERKLRCTAPIHMAGGGAVNITRAVSHLGGKALAITTVGGRTGEWLADLLAEEGLAHRLIRIREPTRQSFAVGETGTGRQFRFNVPGPAVSAAEAELCLAEIASLEPFPAYVIGSGSLSPGTPVDFYGKAALLTRARGSRFVLDTSGRALRVALVAGVYLLKSNRREMEDLTGFRLESDADIGEAAMEIVRSGSAEAVVVSLAAEGAVLVNEKEWRRYHAPQVKPVSTVGAGDSMVAGIVLSLVRGSDLYEAVRFGIATGTATVLCPQSGLCRSDDVEHLLPMVA